MIRTLAHACYRVRDLKATEEFYAGKLGFRKAFDFRDDKGKVFGMYFHVGGRTFVEFFEGGGGTPTGPASFQHICLEVEDFEGTVAALRKKGVEATGVKLGMDQSWQAWIQDPDGNRIELHAYTPESWQAPSLR